MKTDSAFCCVILLQLKLHCSRRHHSPESHRWHFMDRTNASRKGIIQGCWTSKLYSEMGKLSLLQCNLLLNAFLWHKNKPFFSNQDGENTSLEERVRKIIQDDLVVMFLISSCYGRQLVNLVYHLSLSMYHNRQLQKHMKYWIYISHQLTLFIGLKSVLAVFCQSLTFVFQCYLMNRRIL